MAISVAKMNGLLLFLMTIGAIIATDAAGAGDDRIMQRTTASSDGPDPAGDCMAGFLHQAGIDRESAGEYLEIFKSHRMDETALKYATPQQLEEIGLEALGDRIKIHNCTRGISPADCKPSVCDNGGTCQFSRSPTYSDDAPSSSCNGSFCCSCKEGFTGEYCKTVINPCALSPCLNGGVCVEINSTDANQASCQCPNGYSGDYCQLDNYCHSEPCQNGGSCTHSSNGYKCSCPHGFYGEHCETALADPMELNKTKVKLDALQRELNTLASQMPPLEYILATNGPRFFQEWMHVPDILTGITQAKHFTVSQRHFLGVVYPNMYETHYGIIVYELTEELLIRVQTIAIEHPKAFETFTVEDGFYLAVADFEGTSTVYKWNGQKFSTLPFQSFSVTRAYDVSFHAVPNGGGFLAFSSYHNTMTHNSSTSLYIWNTITSKFHEHVYQPGLPLQSAGAKKLHFFTVSGNSYLSIASEYSWNGSPGTESQVFKWNGTHFNLFQNIPTHSAEDLYPMVIGCQAFLVAANHKHGGTYNTDSFVYLLEGGRFREFAKIPTKGARAVHHFGKNGEYFVMIANSHDASTRNPTSTESVLYRIDGTSFIPFQSIQTEEAFFIDSFRTPENCLALVISNKAGKTLLYKWNSISLKENSCCL